MVAISRESLAASTLSRQFPALRGLGPAAVLDLFIRLGPTQSQVPRSPFLTAASRLPGSTYETINGLFAEHQLLRTSSIRGTVHTSVRAQFGALDVVARQSRQVQYRQHLKLSALTGDELMAETEAYADLEWRHRPDIVAHLRRWLAEHDPVDAQRAPDVLTDALLWGHSGLLRRPRDGRWERRTDVYHRSARMLLPDIVLPPFEEALATMVRVHLGAYGPAGRDDLSYFFGTHRTAVDQALARLGEQLVALTDTDGDIWWDLAEPPAGGSGDPGTRLLPEFDGLLLGFHGRHRTRFLTEEQLGRVWAKVNGLYSPAVLHHGAIVATWKTLTKGTRVDLEVRMLSPHPALTEADLADPVRATEAALGLTITELRIRPDGG